MKLVTLSALVLSSVLTGFSSLSSHAQDIAKTSAPYWNLNAKEGSPNSTIRFYSAENRLLYEEDLPKEMAQLTPRNVTVFNEVLASVINRRLIGYQLSSTDEPVNNTGVKRNYYDSKQVSYKNGIARFVAAPEMKSPGKLQIYYSQLDEELVSLTLTSTDEEYIHYQDKSKRLIYRRVVDIRSLPTGTYKLTINRPDQSFSYEIKVDQRQKSFSVHFI